MDSTAEQASYRCQSNLEEPMSTDTITEAETAAEVCTLDIGGMTCGSCVGRIEKAC